MPRNSSFVGCTRDVGEHNRSTKKGLLGRTPSIVLFRFSMVYFVFGADQNYSARKDRYQHQKVGPTRPLHANCVCILHFVLFRIQLELNEQCFLIYRTRLQKQELLRA